METEIKGLNWPTTSEQYFKEYGRSNNEIKVSREVATQICERAYQECFWILGIDCGQIVDGYKYLEDYNEGWLSKFALMSEYQKQNFETGLVSKFDLYNNNQSALLSCFQIPEKYTVFITTLKKVDILPK